MAKELSDDVRAVRQAIRSGDVDEACKLLALYPHLVRHDYGNGTWLHHAASKDSVPMIDLLVELGCDVNAEKNNSSRDTPLFCALVKDNVPVVKALLENGADPNKNTPVITACVGKKKNSLAFVKLLDQHGADLHATSWFYSKPPKRISALSTAIDWGKEDVAEYLRSRGCVLPKQDMQPPKGEPETLAEEVIAYFEANFGPVRDLAIREIVPTQPRITVHCIPAGEGRDCVTLFTTGMSDEPMNAPDDGAAFQYAEMYIQLPADWKYDDLRDPNFNWPIEWLRSNAQYPHAHQTWLGGPVALIANGDPPQPLAPNSKFTTLLCIADKSFTSCDGRTIKLYRMTPIYTEERDLEIREGLPALMHALDRHNVSFVVDLNRLNVAI